MFNHVSWNAWNPTSNGIDTNPQNNASNGKPWKKPTKTQKPKKTKNEKKKKTESRKPPDLPHLVILLVDLAVVCPLCELLLQEQMLIVPATYRYKRFPQVFFPLIKPFPLSLALQPFPPRRLPSRPFPSRAIQAALPEEPAKRKVLVSMRLLVRRSFAAGGIRTANLLGDTQTPSQQASQPARQRTFKTRIYPTKQPNSLCRWNVQNYCAYERTSNSLCHWFVYITF